MIIEKQFFLSILIFHNFIIYLMSRSFFAIKASLYRYGAIFVDEELSLSIGASVDRIGDLALATLIRIGGPKCFQAAAYSGILRHSSLYIGFLELWLIVIDISQFHDHPGIGYVIFVVVIVLALER